MKRIVFERVVVRRGTRSLGPLSATFGPGVHGLALARLEDLATLEGALARGAPAVEGTVRCETDGPRRELVSLSDLLPLPAGHTLERFAKLVVGSRSEAVLARSGLEAGRLTETLGALEALSFAVALVAEIDHAGAVLVPSPHTLVPATLEREAAKVLRGLAHAGLPVVILLAPGLQAPRFVDDLVAFDEAGLAGAPVGVSRRSERALGLCVRGNGLTALAQHMFREGFTVTLDEQGRELTVHAPRLEEAERTLTEALSTFDGAIEEVLPCP